MNIEGVSALSAAFPVESLENQKSLVTSEATPPVALRDALTGLASGWDIAEAESQGLSNKLPTSIEPLIRSQLAMNKLALSTQVLSKGADAISSSMRQLQQIGGN